LSPEGALQLLAILPLSLAAGVDLYLTLLFLGLAGRLGWEEAAPGELGDLVVPGVLAAAALLYLVEHWMERAPVRSLFWNAAHTVVRPMAGVFLALMALADFPLASRIAGAVAAGSLTLAAHVTRSGWGLLLAVLPGLARVRFLVSVAEDVGTLALLSLLLDAPAASIGLAGFAALLALTSGRSASGAFGFALRLLRDTARSLLADRRWHGPERFPGWIRRTLAEPSFAPGGGLRGSPAAAMNLPGLGLFRTGWVIVRGGSPLFLYRGRFRPHAIDLGSGPALRVTPSPFHTRVDLAVRDGRRAALYFGLDGPEPEDLRAEFLG
jgi:hypothetical protein